MTKEFFAQQMLSNLQSQQQCYPAMQPQDVDKLAFQGIPGVGHLLTSRESMAEFISAKMEGIPADRQISGLRSVPRLLVTIDGPCASGKTTLAHHLAAVFHAALIHTDDFVVPHAQKTAARLAIPGGNCDAERLVSEVLAPWKAGLPVQYRPYDCKAGCFAAPVTLPSSQMLILEGSYCNLPVIRSFADIRFFLDAPWELRKLRLEQRESPESLKRFEELWIPLENAYFTAYHLPDEGCIKISDQQDQYG